MFVDIWEGTDDPRPEVELFRSRWGVESTILLDPSGAYAQQLGVRGVPTNLVVDSDGIVRTFGASRLEELHAAVDALADPA